MSTNALAILGDGYQITITPEAEKQKATIINAARAVVAVSGPNSTRNFLAVASTDLVLRRLTTSKR